MPSIVPTYPTFISSYLSIYLFIFYLRYLSMERHNRRCGAVAAAATAIALLTRGVADVQGFAFTLQLPGKQASSTSQQHPFVSGGRARTAASSTRDASVRANIGSPTVATSGRSSWGSSRHGRTTALRYDWES